MSTAQVDDEHLPIDDAPTKRRRRRAPLAVTTVAKLVLLTLTPLLCYLSFQLLYYPSSQPITPLPPNLAYPQLAKTAVERAAAIGPVVSTNEYNYTGSKVLGNGTFGYVFTALHRASNDRVAIKSLRSDRHSNKSYADGTAQVLHEARLLTAAAGHPSVVSLHAIAVHPTAGDLHLVMEHAGHSLCRELYRNRSGKPFPEHDVRRVMRQLLAGLEYMHARGVVHRDVKPENILVNRSGAGSVDGDDLDLDGVKICDLGVAMFADEPGPHVRVGTSQYIAPEVLAGRTDYGAKVDMWSLGCVMAELLTGKVAFYAANNDDPAQLRAIYDVLGPPWPTGYNKSEQHDADSKVLTAPPNKSDHRNRLRDLFPEHSLSDEGFDVLKGLLSCDVDQRLSATEALQLPWFAADTDAEAPSAALTSRWTWILSHGTSHQSEKV